MKTRLLVAALAATFATPAMAEENRLEGWFEGSVVAKLDKKSFVEFETQQRARGSSNPIGDNQTYRVWLGTKVGKTTLTGGIHRSKEGSTKETRLMQQASYPLGIAGLKGRTRLEQRFIDGADKTGWRLRQRVGVGVPLSREDGGWEFVATAEGFLTLRATSNGGQTGLTGLRTFLGMERSIGKLDLSVGYTRQQNIRENAPDRVGHAPTLGLTFNL
ncbi:DUF2490 domain-containing protein [Sphingomonas sp. LHG3406-1]|uniref:DUF2490 domain-containing protein n=1 Tax=Sphingomonas sp. LHG3406-1 TaxID=2804617 RepID=UPI0026303177|nr:DUF2490 domain-containing protein [Sphingomonas sp. LHG3406-1]